jgi:hypothetical protein
MSIDVALPFIRDPVRQHLVQSRAMNRGRAIAVAAS